jgi:hypothetical protein
MTNGNGGPIHYFVPLFPAPLQWPSVIMTREAISDYSDNSDPVFSRPESEI